MGFAISKGQPQLCLVQEPWPDAGHTETTGTGPIFQEFPCSRGDGRGTQQVPRQEGPRLGPEGFPQGEV